MPSVEDEDRRQCPRELVSATRDRTRVVNRIKGLLAGNGIRPTRKGDVPTQVAKLPQKQVFRDQAMPRQQA